MFDSIEIIIIRLFLSWGFVAVILLCSYFCFLIARMVRNQELIALAKKTTACLAVYAVARFAASAIDAYAGFEIQILSYVVNYGFWFFVLHVIYKFYKWLKNGFYLDERRREQQIINTPVEVREYSKHVSLGFERQERVSRIFRELIDELKFEVEIRNSVG